ncbi:hypothetical protein PAT3040_02040 [Paenibacillus agaridevorans]|uniref:Uncharacterized protein n=1 Tax=Paenibacillus agaridevorans TaxID=171404 RepID=A0A2R5ER30_9BACL|nr:hypothetical protein [Paenibacillus agaridevorans]GBG07488.1 hypothetical protein PAT3040_02040 [Paenibacillus agaridevorans]
MDAKKIIRLTFIVMTVILIDIAILSPGLLAIGFGENALKSATAAATLAGSAAIILYSSYTLLFKKEARIPILEVHTPEEFEIALKQFQKVKAVENDVSLALHQIDRIKKRHDTLLNVLNQRFVPGGLSFVKFADTTKNVENLFFTNIRGILTHLHIFDEREYNRVMTQNAASSSQVQLRKKEVFREYLFFIRSSLETNEEILLKLDKLILEVSRLDTVELKDMETMPCMQEIDTLIKQTRLYKS